jgi:hypothetical protein
VLVVKLLVLRDVRNILLLDFRFPVCQVRCHTESAFFEEVQLCCSYKKWQSLDIIMCESNVHKVS